MSWSTHTGSFCWLYVWLCPEIWCMSISAELVYVSCGVLYVACPVRKCSLASLASVSLRSSMDRFCDRRDWRRRMLVVLAFWIFMIFTMALCSLMIFLQPCLKLALFCGRIMVLAIYSLQHVCVSNRPCMSAQVMCHWFRFLSFVAWMFLSSLHFLWWCLSCSLSLA